jgi:hypothetical protein
MVCSQDTSLMVLYKTYREESTTRAGLSHHCMSFLKSFVFELSFVHFRSAPIFSRAVVGIHDFLGVLDEVNVPKDCIHNYAPTTSAVFCLSPL